MPRIVCAANALPPYSVDQKEVRELIKELFCDRIDDIDEQLRVFDNARIDKRHFIRPPAWYMAKTSAAECNQVYLNDGVPLLRKAAQACLEKASLTAADVDHIICVSSTGHATPSLEARLFGTMNFSPETKRTPIWGLGCAAGAVGLARAGEYCRAHPDQRVLLLALELCSLTFQAADVSRKNLIGTALFSDGAAAALIAGDALPASGPRILGNVSHLYADTERIMGWDFNDDGMQLVLSPKLPTLILQELYGLTDRFCRHHGITVDEIAHFLMHPGGARVIDACRVALNLDHGELQLSEDSLRLYGNISSVSILLILERWLATQPEQKPGYGLLSAFGPGFSAELLLLEV